MFFFFLPMRYPNWLISKLVASATRCHFSQILFGSDFDCGWSWIGGDSTCFRGRVLSVAKCLSWPRGKCNGQQERKDTGQDSSPRDVSAKVQGPLRQPQCLRCGSADDDSLSSMEGVESGWGGHWAVSFNRGRTL